MNIEFDAKDARIIALLQKDCRISNAELAQQVGMSASALWRRVRVLEEAGVITRYGAVVDPDRLGLGFEAFVSVHLTRHDRAQLREFIRAVELRPEVQECHAITGQADYQLRVLCRDIAAFNQFLDAFLFRQSAVASAQTSVVLQTVKRGAPVAP